MSQQNLENMNHLVRDKTNYINFLEQKQQNVDKLLALQTRHKGQIGDEMEMLRHQIEDKKQKV